MTDSELLALAEQNQRAAWALIDRLDIAGIWRSIGAEVNLVGSLPTGLLMTHRDIDFHIYSDPLTLEESFAGMSRLAAHPAVRQITCLNGMETEERCVEWHAWAEDAEGNTWQLDLIHIQKGSRYDGYAERIAERIRELLTPETKTIILRLKYETPEEKKIIGIDYYRAVLSGGVRTWEEFTRWRENNPAEGVVSWNP